MNSRLQGTLYGLPRLLMFVVLAGGCLSETSSNQSTTSIVGGWSLQLGNCEQRLSIGSDGTFVLTTRESLGELIQARAVSGTIEGQPLTGSNGSVSLTLETSGINIATAPAYCRHWELAQSLEFPLDSLLSGMGLTADAVRQQPAYDSELGVSVLGTDTSRTDRLAFVRDGSGNLNGYSLDNPAISPNPLYHAHPLDASTQLIQVLNNPVFNMPGRVFSITVAGTDPPILAKRVLINVTAAAELRFDAQAGSGLSTCGFKLYEDLFSTLSSVDITPGIALVANPFELSLTYVEISTPEGPGPDTAYLLPIGIFSVSGVDCSARISGAYLALRRVANLSGEGIITPDVTVQIGGGNLHWAGASALNGGRLALVPLNDLGLARAGVSLASRLVGFPDPGDGEAYDFLRLAGGGRGPVTFSPGRVGGDLFLNLMASNGATAGPFRPYARPAAQETLPLTGSVSGIMDGSGSPRTYRLNITTSTRVTVWSQGGLPLRAELVGADGAHRKQGSGGAPDGVGFGLSATLPAGEYDLRVFPGSAAGPFTILIATGGMPRVGDPALEQCLREGGSETDPVQPVRAVDCTARGVFSLDGIGEFTDLGLLDLGSNHFSDITALAELANLERLVLDDNRVTSLAPLAGLLRLRRLSLAGNPVTPAQLSVLLPLAETLEMLNLRGVPTLSLGDVQAFKTGMPTTLLIAPDGTVLE